MRNPPTPPAYRCLDCGAALRSDQVVLAWSTPLNALVPVHRVLRPGALPDTTAERRGPTVTTHWAVTRG